MKKTLLSDPGAASADVADVAVAVPLGSVSAGAVVSGPAAIGGFSVVGRTVMPHGFTIVGDRYSVVNAQLPPGGTYQSEPGAMMYMSPGVEMQARFAGWRMFSGEGLAKLQYINNTPTDGHVGITANMPMAMILPWDTSAGTPNCKRGAFLAGDAAVRVVPKLLPAASAAACCCGGMPPIIQEVGGSGFALLNAGGTIVSRTLAPGEALLVDSDAVVAFTNQIKYDVRPVREPSPEAVITCVCGGEGCFNTELTGPGTVYIQSVSYEKLTRTLMRGGSAAGASSQEMSR